MQHCAIKYQTALLQTRRQMWVTCNGIRVEAPSDLNTTNTTHAVTNSSVLQEARFRDIIPDEPSSRSFPPNS